MSIMQKILDLFKLPNTASSATTVQLTATSTYTPNPKMEQYYKREAHKKENNLNITYQDVAIYDMNPFDLKSPFISDGNFVCIALSDHNLALAYNYLHAANNLIKPFQKYYKDSILPNRLKTNTVYNRELPVSHLRLTPYTSTMRKCKYPLYLWLQDYDNHGYMYLYKLYFDQHGEWKKGDLSFNSNNSTISYQFQIRNDGNENYVRRIDKTLYREPYGTTTLYMDDRKSNK